MLFNKPKEMNKHPFYQSSLPKTPATQPYNSTSTRCISVAKPPQNSHQIVLKPIALPKQLTVSIRPLSTSSERATTKDWCGECSPRVPPGCSRMTALHHS
jgi:hypothetical protein